MADHARAPLPPARCQSPGPAEALSRNRFYYPRFRAKLARLTAALGSSDPTADGDSMATATPKKTVIGAANAEGLPFSQAIKLGNLVFVSGTVGFDESGRIVEGGVGPESRQVFANVEKVLQQAGCTLADIVKVSVVLADPDDFDGYNA